jgi:1-acyl-sn-glycerol-3-phosphate acyltransferase
MTTELNTARYTVFDTPIVKTILRGIALLMFRTLGWRLVGRLPNIPKYVVIGAPHTSYWDAFYGMALPLAFRLKVFWMAKHTVFRPPFRSILSWLGGIPVNRDIRETVVSKSIQEFQASKELVLAVLPEGTRKKVDAWKSGFYHIAMGARVPVLFAFLDYPNKIGGFGPLITLTGDSTADLKRIADFYSTKTGKHPERTGPVRLSAPPGPNS